MFKFAQVFIVLEMLVAVAQGYDLCCCGKPEEKSLIQKNVAFFVGRSTNFGPVARNTDLVFDNLITNVGSAYDRYTSRFTAPVRATYQFSVAISAQHGKKAAVNLMKNGVRVMTVGVESLPNWATSTNVAILSLEVGDQVWLQINHESYLVSGDMNTSFSGFILFKD